MARRGRRGDGSHRPEQGVTWVAKQLKLGSFRMYMYNPAIISSGLLGGPQRAKLDQIKNVFPRQSSFDNRVILERLPV